MLARSSFFPKRFVVFSSALLVIAAAAFCFHVWWAARGAVQDGTRVAAAAGQEVVTLSLLTPTASPFQPVSVVAGFRSAVEFSGSIFVCGSSALFQYSEGDLKRTWNAGRELPSASLLSLAVRTGVANPELWIATDGAGILIYDGNSVRQLLPEKLPLRKISALLPLANGRMLVATPTAGLYLSDGKSLRVFHAEFAHTHITALAGSEDQFWIGTQADGVWCWRGGEALHLKSGLLDQQVLALASTGDRAWVGTPVGVVELAGGQIARRWGDGIFAQALAPQNGKLYIGTLDQGTIVYPLDVHNPRPQSSAIAGESAPIVSFAHLGGRLAAVERTQLTDPDQHKALLSAPEYALAGSHVTALQEDSRGRLWIGYFDQGIDVLSLETHLLRHIEDDIIFCINRIKQNPQDNSLLAATANGLAVFDASGKLRQVLTAENGLISSNVTDMLFPVQQQAGLSLVIATPAGLSFLDRGTISSVYAFQGLVNNHVYTLANLDDTLYAGTLGGLSSLRHGLVQASFNTGNSQLKQNWITASAVFGNQLYLGTYGAGVVRFNEGNQVETFAAYPNRRVEINLNALIATSRALYAGTAGQGLAILRSGEERWHFVTAGLPSLNVTALEARAGRVYVGTDNGLVRISENDLLP